MTTSTRLPVVLVGDAPGQPTGLSRIATDLARFIHAEAESLGVDLLHVGAINWGPLPATGVPLRIDGIPWKTWVYPSLALDRDAAVWTAIREYFGDRTTAPGVIFAVQDPSRSYGLLPSTGTPVNGWQRWGYFLVDGTPPSGKLTGPAGEAIRLFGRVLAYGPYGAGVLEASNDGTPVCCLPHGIDRTLWHPGLVTEEYCLTQARQWLGAATTSDAVIGCVATNVARKDLALFMDVIGELRRRGEKVRGWLHTDQEIGDWSIPQLASDAGLDWTGLSVSLQPLPDTQRAAMMAACALTIAPGRGEGFCYPVLESISVGTPVLHVNYAGGADLIHKYAQMLMSPVGYVRTGLYGIERPYLDYRGVASRAEQWLRHPVPRAKIAAMADPYDWVTLWPQWREWFVSGLEALR